MGKRLFIAGGMVITIGLAACSSSSKSSSSSSAAAAATTTPAAAQAAVSVSTKAGLGSYLVASNGHTLYMFEKETGLTSACTAGCAAIWPALTVTGTPTGGSGIDATKLTTANGQTAGQVAYNGHLLYLFSHDTNAGDVNGTKIDGWYPLTPAGDKIEPATPSTTAKSGY
jgi:predicted lipoprotein with Yx(FWY)xxD motif